MAVKVLVKRKVPADKEKALRVHIRNMRAITTTWPGYISGETLRRIDVPGENLVVSKWRSKQAWENWFNSSDRQRIQKQIDDLIQSETIYEIYDYN